MVKWFSSVPGITSQLVTQAAEWHMTVELPGDLHNPAPRHTLAAWSWVAAQRRNPARHQGLTPSVCYALQREAADFRSSEQHRDTAGTPTAGHPHTSVQPSLVSYFISRTHLLRSFPLTVSSPSCPNTLALECQFVMLPPISMAATSLGQDSNSTVSSADAVSTRLQQTRGAELAAGGHAHPNSLHKTSGSSSISASQASAALTIN